MTALERPGVIRELREDDVAAVVALERAVLPPELFVTEASLRHEFEVAVARSLQRAWLAEDAGEPVGWARAFFRTGMAEAGLARVDGAVRPDRRRRGLGRALYDLSEAHLRANGGTRIYATVYGDPGGEPFLRARGFEPVAHEHLSAIDPARADLSALPALEAARAAQGFRLVPLRELRDRPRDLWELDAAARHDIPTDSVRTRLSYEDWLPRIEQPDLDDEGSIVVLHGDRPVAHTFLCVDRETGRAVNEMTGTLPEFRRRGLGRLVKLAGLRWAREHGIRSIWTDNDEENAAMLALNEELGYRRFLTTVQLAKQL